MDDEFRKKLIEALELIVESLPIGKTATHRARIRVEALRALVEEKQPPCK